MKFQIIVSILLLSLPAFAAKVNNPKCNELSGINEKYTPEYLAVVDGYNKAGKELGSEVDVGGIVTEANNVKEQCDKQKTAKIASVRKTVAKNTAPKNSLQEDIDRKSKSTINPKNAKCQDFIALGEAYQPVAAFWVAGHSKTGKIKNGEVDEEFLEQPVATLVEECKAEPTASFYQKTKTWLKKHI
jgi:acid stress chaperone HdeA